MTKKKKRRLKKKFKLFIFILLVIGVFLIVKPFNKEDIDLKIDKIIDTYEYQNKITNNTSEEVPDEVENLIIDFLNTYFRSMKELKEYDMTKYFSDEEEGLINETALNVLINSRLKQLNDLKLSNVSYDYSYEDIDITDDIITVKIKEDSYLNFNFMKEITSKIYNVESTFEIVLEDNEYKIKSFEKEQGYYIMVDDLYSHNNTSIEEAKEELDTILTNYNLEFDEMLEEQNILYNRYLENKDKTFKTCDHSYDRDSAKEYALKYVLERSSTDYGPYGGNCQNYASWTLNAGGIPMDIEGLSIWKHYDSELIEDNSKKGRTASWTGVSSFYNYAKNNTSYGLCSEVDVNTYYAETGDVIQIGYDKEYRHSAVVIDTYVKDDNVIDVILNSNTGDLEYFPLSAYVYPLKRLIKVLGWND